MGQKLQRVLGINTEKKLAGQFKIVRAAGIRRQHLLQNLESQFLLAHLDVGLRHPRQALHRVRFHIQAMLKGIQGIAIVSRQT